MRSGGNGGDVDALAARQVHGRAVLAAGDDQRLCLREHVALAESGLLPDQLELVVVADDEMRADDAVFELGARHARALLAGVEDVRDAQRAALLGVLHHRAGIVRRNDGQPALPCRAKRQLPGVGHRAGIERRDLVVLHIGAAEKRRREFPRDLHDERRVDAGRLEPLPVLAEVFSRRGHQARALAEQRERVRDIRRAAAAALVHRVDEKAQADPVHVFRQKVLGEFPGEGHQVIERDRAGDDDFHRSCRNTVGRGRPGL